MPEPTQAEPQEDYSGPIVSFRDVSISFDPETRQGPDAEVHTVLDKLSFEVERGQTLIILGPAGCGKSVLMKLANGLIRPDEGEIRIFGKDLETMRETEIYTLRQRIGMVFQESALFDSMNVEDNVAYRLHEEGMPTAEAHKKVEEVLNFVSLPASITKFPSELSGGMRRRVSIARAIVTDPDLILYDSPTGGLDPITSTTIIELVIKQRDVNHTTSLLISHRLQDAFTLATHRWNADAGKMEKIPDGGIDDSTRFLMLNEGKIVYSGDTQGLVHSEDPWIKEYLS
jgi:phospholipid/cholesterol/gamma-HCH transport system ATP-binding protein